MAFLFLPPFVLTKENFEEWSNKKKEELISKGLWEIVENGYEWPKDIENMTDEERKTFVRLRWTDHQALAAMSKNVDEVAWNHIIGEDSAKDSWALLKEIYGKNVMENIEEAKLKETISEAKADETKTTGDNLTKEAVVNETVSDVVVENIEVVSNTSENEKAVVAEFEKFEMKDSEKISEYFTRPTSIINQMVLKGETEKTVEGNKTTAENPQEPKDAKKIEEQEKKNEVETVTNGKDTEVVASELEGEDFNEVFASVSRLNTV